MILECSGERVIDEHTYEWCGLRMNCVCYMNPHVKHLKPAYLKEERNKPNPKGRPPSQGSTAYWDGYNAALGMVIDQMQARIDERSAASGEGEE